MRHCPNNTLNKLPANPPNVLTHPSHIRYHHQWFLLPLLFLIMVTRVCCFLHRWCRSIADKVCRVTILLQDSSKVVNFLLKVVLCADDLSGPVMEAYHHTLLHVGWMMGLKVKIPVGVRGLPVDRDVQAAILSPPE